MDLFKLCIVVLFCIVSVHCVDLPYRTFHCRNGTYIDSELICDGKKDCVEEGDGLDENSTICNSAQMKLCKAIKHECLTTNRYTSEYCRESTKKCKSIDICDKIYTYEDEVNCVDEDKMEECTLNNWKYLCDDGLKCLNISYTCDGVCNCLDCSDEKMGCEISDELSKSSNQACFKTPNGPFCCSGPDSLCQQCKSSKICDHKCVQFGNQEKCICSEKYVGVPNSYNAYCALSGFNDSHSEEVIDEASHQACFNTHTGIRCCSNYSSECQRCDSPDICDQKCVKFGNESGCFCDENYVSIPGTKNAKCYPRYNAAKEKLLLFTISNPSSVGVINLFTKATIFLDMEEVKEHHAEYLVTAARDHVYFAYDDSVFRISLKTNKTEKIEAPGGYVTKIKSFAVDWITNNVYYVHHFSSFQSISVCSNEGKICKTLKSSSGELCFINLAPRFGLMFWISDTENLNGNVNGLMRSSMDGSNEKLLLGMKNSCGGMVTVDELTERIYWYNSIAEEMKSVDFNGENIVTIPYKFELFHNSFTAVHFSNLVRLDKGSTFEKEVFFTNSVQSNIWSLEKNSKTLANRFPLPKIYLSEKEKKYHSSFFESIYVYNPHLHRTKIANPCPASCEQLCLIRPSSSGNTLDYVCTSGATRGGVHTSLFSISIVFGVILTVWLI